MNFNPNLGSLDRGWRIIVGMGLFIMGLLNMLGFWDAFAVAVGGFLLLTAVFTFCPLYAILAVSTAADD